MAGDDTQWQALRFLRLTLSIAAMRLRRHATWLAVALLFGAAVLPFLVYHTGTLTLGPYSGGGALAFLADFYADLAHLRGGAWLLLLGPATLVLVWRVLVAYAWPASAG